MSDPTSKGIIAFGVVTVAFWSSRTVFPQLIPPLVPLPDLAPLLATVPQWIRDEAGQTGTGAEDLASVRRDMIATAALHWLAITSGVASGVLIAMRRRAGRWLALALCAGLLAKNAAGQARLVWNDQFVAMWVAMAQHTPLNFIRALIDFVFYGGSLVVLTRRPVAARLNGPSGVG